jgi:transposase
MAIADRNGLPIAVTIESASPHESKIVEKTITSKFVKGSPERIIGDKAYDSDKLDAQLLKKGIRLIAPNKINRKTKSQDGRELRRYCRRWKIERLFSWLFNFRRIVVRYEYKCENYFGFIKLGILLILLRQF